jgi:cytochrome c oxidase assembly factor CtaG/ferredoxin
VYFRGWRRLAYLRSTRLRTRRLAGFLAGLFALWFAVASPLDAFANFLLTAHMIQHLLIMLVAPPLLLFASPWNPLLRGLPRWIYRDVLGPFLAWPFLKRVGTIVTHPVFCWFAAALALLGWHIPAAYDLALLSPGWHRLEHACLFATSLLFWWPVVQPWPSTPRWPRWSVPLYLLCGDLVTTVLAAFLCFSDRPLYPAYAAVPRLFAISQLDDQITAGALMWVFGSLILLSAAVIATVRLLDSPATRPNRVTPPLRPAMPVRPLDLLRIPIAGAFLRARYGRRALQTLSLLLAAAVVADGLLGHPMSAMNLAGIIPWTYARSFAVLALLTAGNLFCMACPFTLPRELGRRLGFSNREWPRTLRTKWFAVVLLAVFFWAYEAFSIWDRPVLTAWIVIGYFGAAFAVDTVFRGAGFCKYVCPIGQFNFVSSLVSPLDIGIRSRETCAACATHDCIRGNDQHRGCELQLFLPRKQGSLDCTLCLDCVKACPHDNVALVALAPLHSLVDESSRASPAPLFVRPDVAVLALVVVCSAFVTAAAMVPLGWRAAAFYLLALAVLPCLVTAVGHAWSNSVTPLRELFCRLSLALLPLGLSMWFAHLAFHTSTGWYTAWPALQRAALDLGTGRLGAPRWASWSPLFTPGALLAMQLVVLDAGVLLSMYAGWSVTRASTRRSRDALMLLAPWAAIVTLLYAAAVWIFLQPMQMRGMVHG